MNHAFTQTNESDLPLEPSAKPASWWKFWTRKSRKKQDIRELVGRHEEMVEAMRTLCETVERSQAKYDSARAALSLVGAAPAVPVEALKEISKANEEVREVLTRLTGHMETADVNAGRIGEKLQRMDLTLGTVKSVNELSLGAMENVAGSLSNVAVQMDKSSSRYEDLFAKVEAAERSLVGTVTAMQQRSNRILIGLGAVIAICLVAFGVMTIVAS